MIPGVNPRQMKQMMKKMNIQQQDIPAQEVIIRQDNHDIVITNPQVARVNMMGQDTFQISGEVSERAHDTSPDISEEDIQTVVDQTGVSAEKAEQAINEADGDLASAIMKLSE